MNRTLLFFIAVLLLFMGTALFWIASGNRPQAVGSKESTDVEYVASEGRLTEFEFTDQLAKPFGTQQLAGHVWLGSFFFADCPSICVQQNIEISKLHKRFQDQGVKIVNITVAPDNDPPHKLWVYANRFSADHKTWKFLTGRDLEYVIRVGHDIFGLPAANETHTSEIAVFDRDGKMHGTYKVTDALEYAKCVKKVEQLLADDVDAADRRQTDSVQSQAPPDDKVDSENT